MNALAANLVLVVPRLLGNADDMNSGKIPIFTLHRTLILIFLLIEGCLFAGFFFQTGQAVGLRNRREEEPARAQLIKKQRVNKLEIIACANEVSVHLDEVRRAEAGLVAQQSATDWAWWSAFFAGVQIPVSLVGIVAVVLSLRQAREALDQSKQHSDIDLRPWIKMSAIPKKSGFVFNETFYFEVDVKLENVGRNVANNALVNFKCFSPDITDFDIAIKDLRSAVFQKKSMDFDDSIPVLPTDTEFVPIGVRLSLQEIIYIEHPTLGKMAAPSLALWCDYKWGKGRQARSLRLYQIGIMIDGKRHQGLPATMPLNEIEVILEPQYGGFAD